MANNSNTLNDRLSYSLKSAFIFYSNGLEPYLSTNLKHIFFNEDKSIDTIINKIEQLRKIDVTKYIDLINKV